MNGLVSNDNYYTHLSLNKEAKTMTCPACLGEVILCGYHEQRRCK